MLTEIKEIRKMNKDTKKQYETPTIEVVHLEMEQGIAAGSAVVRPTDLKNEVLEEWQVDPDDDRIINW